MSTNTHYMKGALMTEFDIWGTSITALSNCQSEEGEIHESPAENSDLGNQSQHGYGSFTNRGQYGIQRP